MLRNHVSCLCLTLKILMVCYCTYVVTIELRVVNIQSTGICGVVKYIISVKQNAGKKAEYFV